MKITKRTEIMFSQAVALAQNGKMKSHIHCYQQELLVANMDNTIMLKFQPDMTFPSPLSFFANDYESPQVEVVGDAVSFVTARNGYTQTKTCGVPKTTFPEIKAIWDRYTPEVTSKIMLKKEAIGLLDDGLSHVEFHNDKGTLKLLQRNIYTGAMVEVKDTQSSGGLISVHQFPADFRALGLRTGDLQALFSFTDTLVFHPQAGKHWMYFKDTSGIMEGILATCVYDELGYLTDSGDADANSGSV